MSRGISVALIFINVVCVGWNINTAVNDPANAATWVALALFNLLAAAAVAGTEDWEA